MQDPKPVNKQVRDSLLEESQPSVYRLKPGQGGRGGILVAAAFYNAGCANGKGVVVKLHTEVPGDTQWLSCRLWIPMRLRLLPWFERWAHLDAQHAE